MNSPHCTTPSSSFSVVLPPTADFARNDKERRKREAPVRKERERGRLNDDEEARPVIFFARPVVLSSSRALINVRFE